MNGIKNILLSVLTAVLLSASWPETGNQTWLIFIAFVPLLHVIEQQKTWRAVFLFSFLSFITWHIMTDWWMWISTPIGSISAWIINSMLMASVLVLSQFSSKRLLRLPFEIILAFYWLTFEIFHLYWDLKWPWMNLGNAFANQTEWIQWYEYGGAYTGGFWIIIANGLFFRLFKKPLFNLKKIYLTVITFITILGPIALSYHLVPNIDHSNTSIHITIVQPNVNTYTQKFDALSPLRQSEMIIGMLNQTDSGSIILLPETAIPESFNTKGPYPKSIDTLLNYSLKNQLKIIGGFYTESEKESYNSACLIEDGNIINSRNKIKLLAYAEQIPFDFISEYWSKMVHEQGGIAKSFGTDLSANTFKIDDSLCIGTLICFESVFSDINTEMCRKGAQTLVILTNDDWWHNTPGHRQHFAFAKIRAIENRKWIVRCANTGVSGVINAKGEIVSRTSYREQKVLNEEIYLNDKISFFSKYEKQIRWSILSISFLLFFLSILRKPGQKHTWLRNI